MLKQLDLTIHGGKKGKKYVYYAFILPGNNKT